MSATKNDGSNYSDYVGAAVTEDFRQEVRVAAAKADVTVSEYIRRALREKMEG